MFKATRRVPFSALSRCQGLEDRTKFGGGGALGREGAGAFARRGHFNQLRHLFLAHFKFTTNALRGVLLHRGRCDHTVQVRLTA